MFDSRHWESYQRENSIYGIPLQFTCKVLQTQCGNVLADFTFGEGVLVGGCDDNGCDIKCANDLCPFRGNLKIEDVGCNPVDKTWTLTERLGNHITCGTCQTESQKSVGTTTLSATMSTTTAELQATASSKSSEGFSETQNTDSVIITTTAEPQDKERSQRNETTSPATAPRAPNVEPLAALTLDSTSESQNEELSTTPSSTTIESPIGQQSQTTISDQNVENNIESTTSESGCQSGWELTDHGIFKFRK